MHVLGYKHFLQYAAFLPSELSWQPEAPAVLPAHPAHPAKRLTESLHDLLMLAALTWRECTSIQRSIDPVRMMYNWMDLCICMLRRKFKRFVNSLRQEQQEELRLPFSSKADRNSRCIGKQANDKCKQDHWLQCSRKSPLSHQMHQKQALAVAAAVAAEQLQLQPFVFF